MGSESTGVDGVMGVDGDMGDNGTGDDVMSTSWSSNLPKPPAEKNISISPNTA